MAVEHAVAGHGRRANPIRRPEPDQYQLRW